MKPDFIKPASALIPLVAKVYSTDDHDILYHGFEVFVVRMPLNLGGGVTSVVWTIEQAEEMVAKMKEDSLWKKTLELNAQVGLPHPGEFIIDRAVLSPLNLVGGNPPHEIT